MNNSEDVLKELRIERRPGAKKPKRRKWPIFAGLAAAVLAAFIVLFLRERRSGATESEAEPVDS